MSALGSLLKKRSFGSSAPSSSNPSKDGPASKRQKRDNIANYASSTPAAAAAAAAAADYGTHINTKLTYAVEYLKSKQTPKSLQDVLEHLTLQHNSEEDQKKFAQMLKSHLRVTYIPSPRVKGSSEPVWRTGKYEFKPVLPGVNSKEKLLEHLQHKQDASAASVKDIKDGWPDCDGAIDELRRAHRIITTGLKKDSHAKYVWADDPSLHHAVDAEFVHRWKAQTPQMPAPDDMVRALKERGQKPTGEDPRARRGKDGLGKPAQKKRKAARTVKKFQNAHMEALFNANPNKRLH
ncbi:transcription initiation factor IIE, beta subunit [Whalleya microplaca]|nr:transcription initiation factor IIE, beta subunit [Whalleya microplaca]